MPTAAQQSGVFTQAIYDPLTVQNVSGVFTRQPFPGNQIPLNRIDPVAAKVAKLWPAPNTTGSSNFLGSASAPDRADQENIRIDHLLSQTQRLFGRISIDQNFGGLPNWYNDIASPGVFSQNVHNRNGVLSYTNTLSPSMVLDVHYGFTRQDNVRIPLSEGTDLAHSIWLARLPFSNTAAPGSDASHRISVSGLLGLSSSAPLFRRAAKHTLISPET